MTHPFDESGTIGIEEEFYAVDPETLQPADAADELLADPPGPLKDHLGVELFTCVIETQTHITRTLTDARDEIKRQRKALKDHAQAHGHGLIAAGLHPSARWTELEHPSKQRYRDQLERIQYPQRRNLTAGLHVHIGVDDPGAAVYLSDEIRQYIPLLLALSANSPYWQGPATGLASTRAVIFENLPNTGIPTAFDSWEAFQDFERTMLETGSISDRGELWWDVRPHTGYGTVEVRTMDAQNDPETTYGFLVLVKALVDHLEEAYRSGTARSSPRHELLVENKWRALRYGHDASFIHDGDEVGLHEWLEQVLDTIDPEDEKAIDRLTENDGATRQQQAHEKGGMDAVLASLEL